MQDQGRRRVVIEAISPCVDGGRFPIKRVVGDTVTVEADIFADGHDELLCRVLYRGPDGRRRKVVMEPLGNDRWRASFEVDTIGRYRFTIEAWVDRFVTWVHALRKRVDAGQDISIDLQIGSGLVLAAADRTRGRVSRRLREWSERLDAGNAFDPELEELMAENADRRLATRRRPELTITVDPTLAAFSAWYELFPRSASPDPSRSGTLADVEARLPYVAAMGFDVLYLPPVHPIGHAFRKGPNNTENGSNGAVGSPWAIGGPEGGHMTIHPDLGTVKDFRHLVRTARKMGLEIAMDLAYNASPDHPYVARHPEWFRSRPDGTIQYAENPPKRYQDIYPFDFESEHWQALWAELRKVVAFWIDQGVRVFRVDNPHTKPFGFWEWLIDGFKKDYPELIFLSEAFTRPKVMHRLAKVGFSQSYTYFAWRNSAAELREYLTELTGTEEREYFRPNFWTNTQDILTEVLQTGGRPASAMRVVLAATLCTNYGVFGPSFELVETTPLVAGREEYLNSEKYEVRHWDLDREGNLRGLIGRLNHLRRQHAPLQRMRNLRFLRTDNEQLLAYAKTNDDGSDPVVTIVNLDPHWKQSGWVELPVRPLDGAATYQVSDVLNDRSYEWQVSGWNYIELDPAETPAHILVIDRPLLLPEG